MAHATWFDSSSGRSWVSVSSVSSSSSKTSNSGIKERVYTLWKVAKWPLATSQQLINAFKGITTRGDDEDETKEAGRFFIPFFSVIDRTERTQCKSALMKALLVFDNTLQKRDFDRITKKRGLVATDDITPLVTEC